MPYQPGTQDIRGQLWGQGINQFAQGISRGIDQAGKTYDENKVLSSQSKALETLLPQYAKVAGIPDEEIQKWIAPNPDETPRGKVARLSQAMEGMIAQSALKSRQMQDQHMEMMISGEKQRQAAAARAQREQDALNAQVDQILSAGRGLQRGVPPELAGAGPMMARPAEMNGPVSLGQAAGATPPGNLDLNGGGVYSAPAQEEIMRFIGSPAADLRRSGVRLTPDMMAEIARTEIAHRPALPKPAKPMPGSLGYETQDFGELGKIVRDRATGEPVDSAKFIRPHEKKSDEKALTATEIQQLGSLQQAGRDLGMLEERFASYKDPNWGGPVAGRVRSVMSMGTDPRISEIENLVTSATPNLARGVFREVGVLTDEDIRRYRKLLPDVNDTAQQRAQKLKDLKARMSVTLDETLSNLQAAGRDVSGLREKVLADKKTAASNGSPAAKATPNAVAVGNPASVKFPEFNTPGDVEAAIAAGKIDRGSVVRIAGELFRTK